MTILGRPSEIAAAGMTGPSRYTAGQPPREGIPPCGVSPTPCPARLTRSGSRRWPGCPARAIGGMAHVMRAVEAAGCPPTSTHMADERPSARCMFDPVAQMPWLLERTSPAVVVGGGGLEPRPRWWWAASG